MSAPPSFLVRTTAGTEFTFPCSGILLSQLLNLVSTASGIKPRKLLLLHGGVDIASTYPLETSLTFKPADIVLALVSEAGTFAVVVHQLGLAGGSAILIRCSAAMTYGAFKAAVASRTGGARRIFIASQNVTKAYADDTRLSPAMLETVFALREE